MKRGSKAVLGIVSVSVALCMGVSLAACSSKGEHEHTWDNGTVTVEATCTTNGIKTYTCTDCGQTKTETIEATGHSYKETTVNATCTSAGYAVYICENCGALDTSKSSITDAAGHTYDEGTVTTAATCTTAGVMTYTCSVCGATKTEVISALGHDYEVTGTTAPSCTLKGEVTYTCTRCDASYTEVGEVPTGHTIDYTDGVAAEDGSVIYSCSVCGEKVVVDPIEADGDISDIPATEEDGVTTYSVDTAEELANIAAYVNGAASAGEDASMSNAVIKLTDDIDLAGVEWTPIGSATLGDDGYIDTDEDSDPEYAFSGTFDGQGYTISNLRVDSDSCAGLFGYLKDGTVKDLNIDGATINGAQGVGIIAGDCDDNTDRTTLDVISGIRVTGLVQITGTHFVGGIAGRIESTDIEDCSIVADEGSYIKGIYDKEDYEGDAIGGIAGYMGVKESQSYETSDGTDNASHIWDVTVSGLTISGSRKVGGIVGNAYIDETDYAFVSSASYAESTDNEAATTAATEAISGNTVSDCTISLTYVTKDGYTSGKIGGSRLFVGAILGELTTASSSVGSGKITDTTVSGVTVEYIDGDCVYGLTNAGEEGTAYTGFYGGSRDGGTVNFDSCTGSVNCVNFAGNESDSSWQDTKSTEEVDGETVTTYTVDSAAQLVNLAEYINASNSDGEQVHNMNDSVVELESDIDLTGYSWTPIGVEDDASDESQNEPYSGTFDGNGHTISNIEIDSETGDDAVGFFGYIDQATIENLTLENVSAEGSHGVGALAGWCDLAGEALGVHSLISNVTVKGLIQLSGTKQVGGIVGLGNKTSFENCTVDADEGSYIKCEYEDTDNYGQCAGGLVGAIGVTQNTGIVSSFTNCSVKGLDISACVDAGGLIGYEIVMGLRHSGGNAWSHSDENNDEYFKMENCTVEDCNIAIDLSSAPDDFATDRTDLFAGAFVGESLYSMALSNCTANNVTVTTYSTAFTNSLTAADDSGLTYIGFIGGSRSYNSIIQYDYNDCSGEVTMNYVTTTATDND
ncbi:MAG: hypothetical protein LUD51_00155 [Clostridia bacterium]|nr:hypothetical protein [Clostridia bacterium]